MKKTSKQLHANRKEEELFVIVEQSHISKLEFITFRKSFEIDKTPTTKKKVVLISVHFLSTDEYAVCVLCTFFFIFRKVRILSSFGAVRESSFLELYSQTGVLELYIQYNFIKRFSLQFPKAFH